MSKIYLLTIVFFSSLSFLSAQEIQIDTVKIGDKLIIGQPSSNSFIHIDIPRNNFVIKRGGLPNISSLQNQQVMVTDISYGKSTVVTFKNVSGKKFFKVYKTFSTNLDKALETGELMLHKSKV
ncbi:hypothetical protein [Flagellimonas pacifica]|uniref:DUF4138 domain-containing protein n=1 Tax=Flagellimonas pacifica TaxID=1247520 RepID=A0A285MGP0_9FLAO|nr:hypothetical protein [Allomuricauda parva]SNY94641.1 hypothetical protein SAMN06265377_0301 [Allomuricauda parva]